MNFNLYGLNDQWVVVDIGITFGDETTPPGIDIICPDISCLHSIQDRIIGIVITHAHEDHIGALQHLWARIQAPVYCTKFAATVARRKLGEAGLLDRVPLHEVLPGSIMALGEFSLEWISLTHSIPESNGLIIRAAGEVIFHTGDWKLDPHPIEGCHYDDQRLIELGSTGVNFIVGDSTNALIDGWSGSEKECRTGLYSVISQQPYRVAVTCFSSNTARLSSLGNVAKSTGRRISVLGRSLQNYIQIAKATGYLKEFPDLVPTCDLDYLPRSEQLILATGSQGEPRAAMAKLAKGEHPDLVLEQGDTVVFSSKVIPGNEKKLFRLHDLLSQKQISVVTEADAPIHVSGHPSREELRWMYRTLCPEIVIPVHGEERHMQAHKDLVDSMGLQGIRIVNGSILRLKKNLTKCVGQIKTGRLGLIGSQLVPLNNLAFAERKSLAESGVIVISLVLDKKGRLLAEPTINFLGVPTGETDAGVLLTDLILLVEEIISEMDLHTLRSNPAIKNHVQRGVAISIRGWLGIKSKQIVNIMRV